MAAADLFVVLDSVQYEKNYFQNRNKIRTNSDQGWQWLTVPVLTRGRSNQPIHQTEINSSDHRWAQKLWSTIALSYRSAPYFNSYADSFESIIDNQDVRLLVDLNLKLISEFRKILEIETPMVFASELGFTSHRSELLAEISNELKADTYLSGPSGRDYLDSSEFTKRNIKVDYHEFHHPTYSQIHGKFLPYMSTIDLIFNHGPESRDILLGKS